MPSETEDNGAERAIWEVEEGERVTHRRYMARRTIIIASVIDFLGNPVVHLTAGFTVRLGVIVAAQLIELPFDSQPLSG